MVLEIFGVKSDSRQISQHVSGVLETFLLCGRTVEEFLHGHSVSHPTLRTFGLFKNPKFDLRGPNVYVYLFE